MFHPFTKLGLCATLSLTLLAGAGFSSNHVTAKSIPGGPIPDPYEVASIPGGPIPDPYAVASIPGGPIPDPYEVA